MTRAARILSFVVLPVLAALLAATVVFVSSRGPGPALLVWGPSVWPMDTPVPLRVAVVGPDDAVLQIRSLRARAVGVQGYPLAIAREPRCDAAQVSVRFPHTPTDRILVEVRAITARGEVVARARVRRGATVRPDRPVPREGVRGAMSGPVRVDAFPVGGALATSDPLPVLLRFASQPSGAPWSGEASVEVRAGSLQSPAPASVRVNAAGVAELHVVPLLGDLAVDVSAGGRPARLLLPVRPARPTIHMAARAAPGTAFEVRSASGAKCAYVDYFVDDGPAPGVGIRRHADSAPLQKGRAAFTIPRHLGGVVAIQASTHFGDPGEAVTVRHLWVGDADDDARALARLGVALGASIADAPLLLRAGLAALDRVRYPPALLADGGADEAARLAAVRHDVRSRGVAGIGLCALAEAILLGRAGARARRRAREIESDAARATDTPPPPARSDMIEIIAFVAAAIAGFAALAAVAGMV